MESEHYWVVTASVKSNRPGQDEPFELKLVVPGDDILLASHEAQRQLFLLGSEPGDAKFVHITPHFFTDEVSR
jgi:hypothetical protein